MVKQRNILKTEFFISLFNIFFSAASKFKLEKKTESKITLYAKNFLSILAAFSFPFMKAKVKKKKKRRRI